MYRIYFFRILFVSVVAVIFITTDGFCQALSISQSQIPTQSGQSFDVPLYAQIDQSAPVYALGLNVSYDNTLLTLNSVSVGADTQTQSCHLFTNNSIAGQAKIGIYCNTALPTGSPAPPDEIAIAHFTLISTPNSSNPSSPLTINGEFNEILPMIAYTGNLMVGQPVPTVSLMADNSTYTAPATINLTANASVTFGNIQEVDFYNGSSLIGKALTSPYTFPWSNNTPGSYTLTAQVILSNSSVTAISLPVNVTVNPAAVVYQLPVVNAGIARNITLPATAALNGVAIDVDAGDLDPTWSLGSFTGIGAGTVSFSNANALSSTATFSLPGTYVLNLSVQNTNTKQTNSSNVTITVNPTVVVDQPPVITAVNDQTVTAGNTLSFNIAASDSNEDALTYSASNLPQGAIFDPSTRTFIWTPGSTQTGSYTVHFTVSNGNSSVSEDVGITVNPVADNSSSPVITTVTQPTDQTSQPSSTDSSAQTPPANPSPQAAVAPSVAKLQKTILHGIYVGSVVNSNPDQSTEGPDTSQSYQEIDSSGYIGSSGEINATY